MIVTSTAVFVAVHNDDIKERYERNHPQLLNLWL